MRQFLLKRDEIQIMKWNISVNDIIEWSENDTLEKH